MINTPASQLEAVLTKTDSLSVSTSGDLLIEGCSAKELVEKHGSPLYVYSEDTLRRNIRRARAAFETQWPSPVNIMYAIKALTSYAIRAVANDENCGGDCFGPGELHATFEGGADPRLIVFNGSSKTDEDISRAIEKDVCVILDDEQEVPRVERLAKAAGKVARVGIRVKPSTEYLDTFQSDHFPTAKSSYSEEVSLWKWGLGEAAIKRMLAEIGECEHLKFVGYHCHAGRSGRQIEYYTEWNRSYARLVARIYQDTGIAPQFMDLGGGWARDRDPETLSKETMMNPYSIEEYAEAVCSAMKAELDEVGMPIPEVWLEMGRYLIGNAGMLLTTVETIKEDPEMGRSWTHVDAHTFLVPCLEMFHMANEVFLANEMHREFSGETNIVGPHCITGNWKENAQVPEINIGDLVCVLDTGMYGEQIANHFNSFPIPAAVLVNGDKADLIRRRETIEDVFATQVLPDRLRKNV